MNFYFLKSHHYYYYFNVLSIYLLIWLNEVFAEVCEIFFFFSCRDLVGPSSLTGG